ncbi:DNA polymerase-4 [Paenibacillus jamilae]|jgi:nucleotidyltransferase/DNA polymerase involved in DNA repair|nr:DNA polymerase-4 [Paenibacillus jamilae]
MQHYIDVSLKITEIYNEYTDLVEVFSIDEQFLDMSGSLSLFGDPLSIASEIQRKVLAQTGVWIRTEGKV